MCEIVDSIRPFIGFASGNLIFVISCAGITGGFIYILTAIYNEEVKNAKYCDRGKGKDLMFFMLSAALFIYAALLYVMAGFMCEL